MASKVRSGIAAAWLRPTGRSWLAERRRRAGLDDATRRLLLGAVMPLGIGGGLADWEGHRRSDIEHTAGTKEAVIHAAMMTEPGVSDDVGPVCRNRFRGDRGGVWRRLRCTRRQRSGTSPTPNRNAR